MSDEHDSGSEIRPANRRLRVVTCGALLFIAAMPMFYVVRYFQVAELLHEATSVGGSFDVIYGGPAWFEKFVGHQWLIGVSGIEAGNFREASIDDAWMSMLANIQTLQTLDLSYCKVGDNGMRHLKNLNTLKQLNLSYTQISDAGAYDLTGLPLRALDLTATAISDKSVMELASIESLESLSLDRTAVTDAGVQALVRLPKLRQLSLRNTYLSPAGLAHIAKMKSLVELRLDDYTQVRKTDVDELQLALPGCQIIYEYNQR